MIFDNKNFYKISKEQYDSIYAKDKEYIYVYHFIIFKCLLDGKIKYIKIDNEDSLNKVDNKFVVSKYFITKLHYFNDCNNDNFEYGEPYYILGIGYFFIGGFINTKEEDNKIIKLLFDKYDKEYKSINLDNHEFLLNNKKLI